MNSAEIRSDGERTTGNHYDVPAVIDESTVTDVTGTVGDENGAEDAFADEFDAAAVDCDGGAGVVAAVK